MSDAPHPAPEAPLPSVAALLRVIARLSAQPEARWRCSRCWAAVPEAATECYQCGAALEAHPLDEPQP
jgi:predicted amidophosphoribosyltransferase